MLCNLSFAPVPTLVTSTCDHMGRQTDSRTDSENRIAGTTGNVVDPVNGLPLSGGRTVVDTAHLTGEAPIRQKSPFRREGSHEQVAAHVLDGSSSVSVRGNVLEPTRGLLGGRGHNRLMALLLQRSPEKNFLSHPLNFVRFQQISSYVGTEAQRRERL